MSSVDSRRTAAGHSFRCAPLLCSALLVWSASARGADTAALPDGYRNVIERGVANGAFAGVAVGLIEKDAQSTAFFGAEGARPDAASRFEIGAITDVLTGIGLARAVLEGKVRLDDTLGSRLPEAAAMPDAAFATVTLAELATQQSGLPATPGNLFPDSLDDPFAGYGEGDLLRFLANDRERVAAGGYSILNAGIAAAVLARAYGGGAATLLVEKVLTPLGMTHTNFNDDPELLAGHLLGAPAAHWHFDALAPAAGLRSTLDDLLALVRANLRPEASSLRAALLLARQPRADLAHGSAAFGWTVEEIAAGDQTWPLVWRASITGGFSAFVGFRTDRQQGLVLLASSATDLAPLGLSFLTDRAPPPVPTAPYQAGADELQRYPGLYRLIDGGELTIRAETAGLTAQLRGSPAGPLLALSDGVFAGAGGSVTFVRNIDTISGVLVQGNGRFVAGDRLSVRAPRLPRAEFAVDAGLLTQYAGDYLLDSGLLLRVGLMTGGITGQFTGSGRLALRAYASDSFADADGTNLFVFGRDEHGHVDRVSIDLAGGEHAGKRVVWALPTRAPEPAPLAEDKQ